MSSGRRRIGTITGPTDMSAGIDRLQGFRDGLGELYDPSRVEAGLFTTQSGTSATAALLERHPDLDALFAASDLMALGAYAAVKHAGRRIPDDIAIVGFDDIPLAEVSDPPLTTVRQHTVDQGRLMARMLVSILEGGSPQDIAGVEVGEDLLHVSLPVELVVRESA